MSKFEAELLEAVSRAAKKHENYTREQSLEFLIQVGIVDGDGNLTSQYRSNPSEDTQESRPEE